MDFIYTSHRSHEFICVENVINILYTHIPINFLFQPVEIVKQSLQMTIGRERQNSIIATGASHVRISTHVTGGIIGHQNSESEHRRNGENGVKDVCEEIGTMNI